MIIPNQYIKFKEGIEKELIQEWQSLRPNAQIIAEDMAFYCHLHGFDFIITDIMSDDLEDKLLNRVSSAHSEGRAFDFRIHKWTKEFLDKFEKHFETKYARFAAISKKSGKRNLIQYHDNGNGNHGHCQIKGS
jgi:hypothetical protein